MRLVLVILLIAVLFGGYGSPLVGYGSYGWGQTGGVSLAAVLIVLALIFGGV